MVGQPGHELASRQQRHQRGVLDFEVAGGCEAAWQFIDASELMSLTSVMRRLRVHLATTTYGRSSEQQREEADISKSLIRTTLGLEDLRADCERGTAVAHRACPSDDGSTTIREPNYDTLSGDLIDNRSCNAHTVFSELLKGDHLIKVHVAVYLICHGVNLACVLEILGRGWQFAE